jgi:hypothetical protein
VIPESYGGKWNKECKEKFTNEAIILWYFFCWCSLASTVLYNFSPFLFFLPHTPQTHTHKHTHTLSHTQDTHSQRHTAGCKPEQTGKRVWNSSTRDHPAGLRAVFKIHKISRVTYLCQCDPGVRTRVTQPKAQKGHTTGVVWPSLVNMLFWCFRLCDLRWHVKSSKFSILGAHVAQLERAVRDLY